MTQTPAQPAPHPQPRPFLDVPYLLEASEPRRPVSRAWLFLAGLAAVMVTSALVSGGAGPAASAVDVLSALLMMGLMGGLVVLGVSSVRRVRAEQQAVEAVGEMVQLKRWAEAGAELDRYLASPARSWGLRAQALVFLGAVLARYERFADAIAVYEHLLDSGMIEPSAAYGLKVGRAMAMLHEDHLVDADRAITELRRSSADDEQAGGLALVELYRDVKTGHHADAVERFERTLPALRQQLGHRVADAWALVARSLDVLGRPADAARAFRNATLLAPPAELFRRYAEVRKLEGRYEPAYAPEEAA